MLHCTKQFYYLLFLNIWKGVRPNPVLECGSLRSNAWDHESLPYQCYKSSCSSQEEEGCFNRLVPSDSKKIASKKESMGEIMKTSSFAQTEAKYISRENGTLSSRISKMHLLKFDQSRKMLLV